MKLWSRVRLFFAGLARRVRRRAQPTSPDRFRVAARLHALGKPDATAVEWERFAVELAADAYWQGVARGIHRGQGRPLAEEERLHAWQLTRGRPWLVEALAGRDPADPLRGVPAAERRAFVEALGRATAAGVDIRLSVAEPGSPHAGPQGRGEGPPVRSRK